MQSCIHRLALAFFFSTLSLFAGIADGLNSYYPFTGDANDSGPASNNLIVNGPTLTPDRNGIPGKAYFLDGIDDYLAAERTIDNVTNSFTIAFWFRADKAYPATTVTPQWLLFPSHGSDVWNDNSAGAGIAAGNDRILIYQHSADYVPIPIDYRGSFSTWTHLALVYRDGTPVLFINGKQVAEGPKTDRPVRPSNGQRLSPRGQIGGFGGAGSHLYFKGAIDEVRYYGRPLSPSEVLELFSVETDATVLSIYTAVEVEFFASRNIVYQIQISEGLNGSWIDLGPQILGTGELFQKTYSIRNRANLFYRIRRVD